ncbi:MAG TPA: hypothetical protein VIK98_09140 [Limnochordales bacterium]
METLLVAVIALGLTSLSLGFIGLASGRLDRRVIRTRARAGCLAALGLSLLFLGAAPPTRAAPGAADLPDTRPPVPVRAALRAAEQDSPAPSHAQAVFPEQAKTLRQWEDALLTRYEEAERALHAVPAVLEGLSAGTLDRFTAWVHLARYSQDIKQAHLALHDLTPPASLNIEHQRGLQEALDNFHYSLANKRAAIVHLQQYARTLRPDALTAAKKRLDDGEAQRARGLLALVQVKAQLGLVPSSPVPASAVGPPAER